MPAWFHIFSAFRWIWATRPASCFVRIKEVARTAVKMTVPAAFTASETFDVGSTVSRDYYERRPFKFDGTIGTVKVSLKGARSPFSPTPILRTH